MPRRTTFLPLAIASTALFLFGTACSSPTDSSSKLSVGALADAFTVLPMGYSSTQNTFDSTSSAPATPWGPDRHGPPIAGGGFGGMMGGGLDMDFMGGDDRGLGRGFGRGPFGRYNLPGNCTFSSTTGRVTCPDQTMNGITVSRSFAFTTSGGVAQSAFDTATTNTVNSQTQVSGTFTRRDSSVTVVQSSSNRTVSGLAKGSTQRTVNGTSAGQETTTGTSSNGAFTAVRTIGDTTTGLIIPVSDTTRTYPTAGTIIRAMQNTLTYTGQTPTTTSRREVLVYDGSTTAKLTITQNGTTKNCTVPLPFGRPTCQ